MAGARSTVCLQLSWNGSRGETLARLRSRLAVDDAGRLSPLVAARLGRDLFDLLCRMSPVGEGFVHRDISPANIMVRTARLPLDRQLAEGTFTCA